MDNEDRSAALRLAGWILKDALAERFDSNTLTQATYGVVEELAKLAMELEALGMLRHDRALARGHDCRFESCDGR